MGGWSVDVPGVEALLGTLDGDVGALRASVTEAESAISGCSSALRGPVASAFSSFAASRIAAPEEVVTMSDNAAGAVIGAVAALSVGNDAMANQMRAARVGPIDGSRLPGRWAVEPW